MSEKNEREGRVGREGPIGLVWPPPGLERTQGDLLVIASRAALAGMMLVLPLLFVTARELGYATLGPFADAWWVTALLATLGLGFALDALTRLGRAARRAAHALDRGYDLRTIVLVLADAQRDMGFLLTGARHFSAVEPRERVGLATVRMVSATLLTVAGLWLLGALAIGLFLAARGSVSADGLRTATLVPATLLYALGGFAALVQDGRVRRARKLWHRQPWSEDLAAEEVSTWLAAARSGGIASGRSDAAWRRPLVVAGGVVAALAVLLTLPVLTLVPMSAVAPILTAVSMPTYDSYRQRAARAEAYRSHVVDGDVSLEPAEAGRLLQDLMFVGVTDEPSAGEQAPTRRFDQAWFPEGEEADNPFELAPFTWADSLIPRVGAGLDAAGRAYLAEVAAHPASAHFSRLATATALDAASARWTNPLPDRMSMAMIPTPRFRPVRDAAKVHIAAAALALAEGRNADAERRLEEVISVGFLLADHGPTLLDNVVGYSLVEDGGGALRDFYRAAGRTADAAALSRLMLVAERSAALTDFEYQAGPEAFVRSLPGMVLDTTLVRGLRWEYFITLTTMAPCLNLNRIVFGADAEYPEFLEEARAALVQWPSEEGIFDLARYGWIGTAEPAEATLLTRVAGLYMSTDEDSCQRFVRHMAAGELF